MTSGDFREEMRMKSRRDQAAGLFWLEVSAGLVGLISLGVFVALLTHSAWAADPRPGFPPGARPFNAANPFANQGGAVGKTPPADFLEEDDEEDSDEEDFTPPARAGGSF